MPGVAIATYRRSDHKHPSEWVAPPRVRPRLGDSALMDGTCSE
ncbi:hypothetical protein CIHG_03811 [Coccidioides immitis H538.4]|uniref:Uncharacterized protein n=1 Tax=Coccidioides immitis H538.4 TaxID=396776 RepID=A0A0J8RMD8_COCIT|nr:hypothetical protein CIHG_03811 [Coccidioides immitis H538.4]